MKLERENKSPQHALDMVNARIDTLESYSRKANLIFSGIPTYTFCWCSVSELTFRDAVVGEHSADTEKSVMACVLEHLNVHLTSQDICIVHRLKQRSQADGHQIPPPNQCKVYTSQSMWCVLPCRRGFRASSDHRIYVGLELQIRTDVFRWLTVISDFTQAILSIVLDTNSKRTGWHICPLLTRHPLWLNGLIIPQLEVGNTIP